MTLSGEGLLILGIIITMMLADMLYNGARIVLEQRTRRRSGRTSARSSRSASVWALGMQSIGNGALSVLMHVGFWWHSAFVLIFLNLLPYSKHFHIITAIPNVFARNPSPNASCRRSPTSKARSSARSRSASRRSPTCRWKDVLDLYTCTECGRCSDNCPAHTTGKKLSPKHLTLALRDHLYKCEPVLLKPDVAEPEAEAARPKARAASTRCTTPIRPRTRTSSPTTIVDLVPERHPPRRALGVHHLPRLRRAVPGDDQLRRQDRARCGATW